MIYKILYSFFLSCLIYLFVYLLFSDWAKWIHMRWWLKRRLTKSSDIVDHEVNKYVLSWTFWYFEFMLSFLTRYQRNTCRLVFCILFGLLSSLSGETPDCAKRCMKRTEVKKNEFLFYFNHRFALIQSRLERKLYEYNVQISSLQSTLLSPCSFRAGPDVFVSDVKRTRSFRGWTVWRSCASFSQTKGFAEWLNQKNDPPVLQKGHILIRFNTLLPSLCTVSCLCKNTDWQFL